MRGGAQAIGDAGDQVSRLECLGATRERRADRATGEVQRLEIHISVAIHVPENGNVLVLVTATALAQASIATGQRRAAREPAFGQGTSDCVALVSAVVDQVEQIGSTIAGHIQKARLVAVVGQRQRTASDKVQAVVQCICPLRVGCAAYRAIAEPIAVEIGKHHGVRIADRDDIKTCQ